MAAASARAEARGREIAPAFIPICPFKRCMDHLFAPAENSAKPPPGQEGNAASLSASPPISAKRCQKTTPLGGGLRGTDRPRPLRKLGSLSAPRLCGDILGPMPCALPLFPPRFESARKMRPGPYSARRQRVRTPEAGPLACRRWSGLAICLGPLVSAGTSGAATPIPRSRRSAARVLMDEGWAECNAASRGGDKFAQTRHPGESRDPGAISTEPATLDTGLRRYDGSVVGYAP